ncbi:MAG: LemA family protein [Candidatus Woesearchaeota archaeon]
MKQPFYKKPIFWIVVVIVILGLWFFSSYNGLVKREIAVDKAWSDIEVQYQRRFDLIPNLVNTVKGYAGFEERVITEVTEARSEWQEALARQNTAEAVNAANRLETGLSRLIAVAENYPDLKASKTYLALMDELAGTENRVAVARTRYNEAAADFNYAIRRIPTNIVAGIFGFEKKTLFEAKQDASEVVKVEL